MNQPAENSNLSMKPSAELYATVSDESLPDHSSIDPDILFSLANMIQYSEKGGNPYGFESMTSDGKVPLSWARGASNYLEPEHYQCLIDYYGRKYEIPITVRNTVKKFKKIKVLGYTYSSRLTGRNVGIDFVAYRQNDDTSDDLEGVVTTDNEEHLRAGSVDYFFCHQAEFTDNDGKLCNLDHYFAFVNWFKNPRDGRETLSQYTGPYMRPFRDEYEKNSSYSILPVQKMHVPVHMMNVPFAGTTVVVDLPRRIV